MEKKVYNSSAKETLEDIDMIIANIINMIKEKWKVGRNRHNNSQYFIGKEWWIFNKMLAKDMHQILQIEFKNCIFSDSKFPLRHPDVFTGQKLIMPNEGIKTRKVGGIDMKITNVLLKMNNGFQ